MVVKGKKICFISIISSILALLCLIINPSMIISGDKGRISYSGIESIFGSSKWIELSELEDKLIVNKGLGISIVGCIALCFIIVSIVGEALVFISENFSSKQNKTIALISLIFSLLGGLLLLCVPVNQGSSWDFVIDAKIGYGLLISCLLMLVSSILCCFDPRLRT